MKFSSLQRQRILCILILIILLLGIGSIFVLQEEKEEPRGPASGTGEKDGIDYQELLVSLTMSMIERQTAAESEVEQEFATGKYSLEEPLVVLDPYSVSPLTAIAMFRTDEPCQVSIHISAKFDVDEINFTFEEYKTEHRIPIYGLYADAVNQITLKTISKTGQRKEATIEITTAEVPLEIKNRSNKYQLKNVKAYQNGVNFVYRIATADQGKWAFDSQGECRWYISQKGANVGTILEHQTPMIDFTENGYFYTGCGPQLSGHPLILLKMDFMGKIIGAFFADNCIHHELVETDDETLIVLGANPKTPPIEQDGLYEIDLNTGEMIHFLDYKDILMRTRQVDPFVTDVDWAHLNAAVPYGSDKVIVSSNLQSTVLCNDWSGNIKWMLCNPEEYPEIYKDYILTPVGENFKYSYGQHCVTIVDDTQAKDGILDILLFDNGRCRFDHKGEVNSQNKEQNECYSRMVVYRINEKEMTVQQLWSYGEKRTELYSPWRSSAQLLANGNYLGMFSVGNEEQSLEHLAYIEVNPIGEVIWELHQENILDNVFYGYRVKRLPFYSEIGNNFHWGTSATNLIPQEILSQYGYTAVSNGNSGSSVPEEPLNSLSTMSDEDIIWQIEVNDLEVKSILHSVEQAKQYMGGIVDVEHEDIPSDKMQFLLLNLTVSKQATGNIPFTWEDLSLSISDKIYSRMQDDSFLPNHGYQRLPSTELKLGSKSGWICFEVPMDVDLNSAQLIYQKVDSVQKIPLK